jgi:DNA-binding protein YbaB
MSKNRLSKKKRIQAAILEQLQEMQAQMQRQEDNLLLLAGEIRTQQDILNIIAEGSAAGKAEEGSV